MVTGRSGTITADTNCNDKFDSREHHSVIRNGLELEGDEIVIAIEYHYDNNYSTHNFYAASFVAPYLPSMGDCRPWAGAAT